MIKFPSQTGQPTVMKKDFSRVPQAQIQRSAFDRSHGYKTTFDAGLLIPFYWDYAYPSDTHSVSAQVLARLATPKVPSIDNLYATTFFFAIPIRLILSTWQLLMGEQEAPQTDPYDPPPANTHLVPQLPVAPGPNGWTVGSIFDYFALPTGVTGITASVLRFRAYNLVWNEWFRDQNQQAPVAIDLTETTPDVTTDLGLLRRGKRHDYFTSCLPWPQKSEPVAISMAGTAPVNLVSGTTSGPLIRVAATGVLSNADHLVGDDPGSGTTGIFGSVDNPFTTFTRKQIDPNGTLEADLSGLTSLTLNDFFQAYAMQQLFMADARGGSRYTELNRYHFGAISADARLQRPEYLGGGHLPVVVSPIPQTSETDATTPQGNLAAMGIVSGNAGGFTYSSTEHCILLGLICVDADLTYQQGIEREESARTRYDFYWPALANLGEQAVLKQELFADASPADAEVFGYQEAWAHLRYKKSNITGELRSTFTTSLDVWHYSEEFSAHPELGPDWIESNPPVDRTIAVTNAPHFILDSYIKVTSVRPMPVFSVPGIFNRF